jgi:formylmethanofuran dehydrogenase subunit A
VSAIRISGGQVHDPANDVDGEVREICIQDGKVVAEVGPDARRIDARGMVVMPGGVDIHAHIAGPKVNAARKLSPDDRRDDPLDRTEVLRSGTGGLVPSTFATGYRYSLLGYTTVVEAAAPPLAARHVLSELRDTPIIDKAFLILMGNNQVLFELIRESGGASSQRLRDAIAWWLQATGGYGVKLVNPGGVELWKQRNGTVESLDDEVTGFGVTPRQILEAIGGAVDELRLPHPVHIHANNLGIPGNAEVTLDTMRTLSGRQAHFAHVQFHSYGGKPGGRPRSRAPDLLEFLGSHPEITVDVGQVMFGPALTMTADAHVSALLRDITHGKWINHDTEVETGCGIVPYTYRAGNYVHALQWGIGLELFLLGKDPWQVMLSTDHPNGGSFLSYPKLIRLLMDRGFREDQMRRANQRAIRRTALPDGLDREYTLNEIAIITRAGPARRLGLCDKGHLGLGADADVTIYHDRPDREEMFATPRYVIKGGELTVDDGELRRADDGILLSSRAAFDPEVSQVLKPLFAERYTVAFDHYPVHDPALREPARIVEAGESRTTHAADLQASQPDDAGAARSGEAGCRAGGSPADERRR